MIPKIIHYCWISGEENMPDDIKACIGSWHKYLPDYEFINWNDSNFDWNTCEFTKHCRENNLYAFCSDYVRFWALYNYGGIYLDSDVMVYRSFDDLLKLKRIITTEYYWMQNRLPEAAILGCEKGDKIFGDILKWYNSSKEKFVVSDKKNNYIIAPEIMRQYLTDYQTQMIDDLNIIDNKDEKTLFLLNPKKFFENSSNNAYAEHLFKGSWWGNKSENVLNNDKLKIFLCCHKPIENYIPKNKKYVILDVTGNAKNDFNDNFHEIIDISQDEFTKEHNVCYGEGCALRYLYNHQDIIPEYIGFGHYRRMFLDFVNFEKQMPRIIDSCGAIISIPFIFYEGFRPTNRKCMRTHHPREDSNTLIECVKEIAPEYNEAFNDFLHDSNIHPFNCFVMKKEDFLEMCDFCFNVLDYFDKKQGYRNNDDVLKKMQQLSIDKKLIIDKPKWQARLQGFYLEYLTDTFYRYKFGIDKCYKSPLGVPIRVFYDF